MNGNLKSMSMYFSSSLILLNISILSNSNSDGFDLFLFIALKVSNVFRVQSS